MYGSIISQIMSKKNTNRIENLMPFRSVSKNKLADDGFFQQIVSSVSFKMIARTEKWASMSS